jgi:hypothetical protein
VTNDYLTGELDIEPHLIPAAAAAVHAAYVAHRDYSHRVTHLSAQTHLDDLLVRIGFDDATYEDGVLDVTFNGNAALADVALDALTPYVTCGRIRIEYDDGEYARSTFTAGARQDEAGEVCYATEVASARRDAAALDRIATLLAEPTQRGRGRRIAAAVAATGRNA